MEEWQVTPFLMQIYIVIETATVSFIYISISTFLPFKTGLLSLVGDRESSRMGFLEKCLVVFLWVCKVYLTIITRARARERRFYHFVLSKRF